MAKHARLIAALLIPALLGGCLLPTAKKPGLGATGATREGTVRGTIPGAKVTAPVQTTGATPPPALGGGLVSNNGAGVISNNSGSLSGIVRAPASLISNAGGGIVGNNAGGYHVGIGGYRVRRYGLLSTVSEVPVAKTTVKLLDAEGKTIVGADGKPLTAETDASGQYSFKGILPSNNLLVAVVLPGDKGTLKAIAPRGGGDARKANMDLISTLTTTYILDQYVKGQADPQQTLDKLPSSVESETRTKAAVAFKDSGLAVPATLSDGNVVQTVTAMREKSDVFDAQMETVKKLLIAAGQSDLGSGRPALEVSFDGIGGLMIGSGGALHIACPYDRRLWRVDAQGKLQTAAGKGVASATSPNGLAGADAGLGRFASVAMDAQGRALILEDALIYENDAFPDAGRLTRLGADGKLTELWANIPGARAVVPGATDEALVLVSNYTETEDDYVASFELWAVKAGSAPVKKVTFSAADSELLDNSESFAGDGQGRLFVLPYGVYDEATETDVQALYKLEPGATALSKVADLSGDDSPVLDPAGNVFTMNYDTSRITVRKVDGTTATVLATLPAGETDAWLESAVLAADGSAYLSLSSKVYKVVNGVATAVAGTGEKQATGQATTVSVSPAGLSIGPAGEIYFSDEKGFKVYRIGVDQQVKLFAGGEEGDGEEPAPNSNALDAGLSMPTIVRVDRDGNVYFVDWNFVYKVDSAGKITTAYRTPNEDEYEIQDFAIGPDGTLYLAVLKSAPWPDDAPDDFEPGPDTLELLRQAPGQAAVKLAEQTSDYPTFVLAATADGVLVASSPDGEGGLLRRWSQAKGLETVKADARFHPDEVTAGGMALDAQGRVYVVQSSANKIIRYEPVTGAFKTIVGAGGSHFNGGSVDTSVDEPGFPCFDKDGNLYLSDGGHRQIKRIPASQL